MNTWRSTGLAILVAGVAGYTSAPPAAAQAAAAKPAAAPAATGEMTGKVVWVDLKHAALLLECLDNGCVSVGGKKGETYTSMIPDTLKKAAEALKEESNVKVTFVDRVDGGRTLTSVTPQ